MAKAALALHAATLEMHWLAKAEALMATLRAHHWDAAEPGYFVTADDAEALIVRPKAMTDEAVPSATSVAAQNLVRLWHLTGNDICRADIDAILGSAGSAIAGNLFATTGLLNALDLRLNAIDVVIVAPPGGDDAAMMRTARANATPNMILSRHAGTVDLRENHPAHGKTAVGSIVTAYVCRGETCSLPVTDATDLAALLSAPATSPA
jgi:uncharacterized protein YyaL (SSP411 family)